MLDIPHMPTEVGVAAEDQLDSGLAAFLEKSLVVFPSPTAEAPWSQACVINLNQGTRFPRLLDKGGNIVRKAVVIGMAYSVYQRMAHSSSISRRVFFRGGGAEGGLMEGGDYKV